MTRSFIIAFVMFTGPSALSGQATSFRLAVGDSLVYLEKSQNVITIQAPQGAVEMKSWHDGHIAIVGRSSGRAQAWYRSLILKNEGPGGVTQTPDTKAMLTAPFELEIRPNAKIRVISAPVMPDAIAAITDLTRQFDDFLIKLPTEKMAPRLAWSDSITTKSSKPNGTYEGTYVSEFTVQGDTTIGNARVWKVGVVSQITIESSMPGEAGTLTATIGGVDSGFALIRSTDGVMLRRVRRGDLKGKMKMTSGNRTIDLPQTVKYESTIERK
jgi:hypothetical protein